MVFKLLFASFLVICISSCNKKQYGNSSTYSFKSETGKPDYQDLHYWAAHPWKWDPSDSIPKPLKPTHSKDTTVDVFFIHPTTFLDKKNKNWNALIDDSILNNKTDYSTILYQASAFNNGTRVFAPRYRQAHIRAFFSDNKLKSGLAFNLAYSDVKDAFDFYLKNYNNGRPIIIASHSQGTLHAGALLKEYFDGKKLSSQLVCAYVIGMPMPDSYFSNLLPCKDSLSTDCFVGWRTYEKNYIDTAYISKENFKSWVTNPLTWQIDNNNYGAKKLNQGGILKNFNKIYKAVVDAQIHENILWSSKPKFFGSFLITNKNYHIGDINLFYFNIQQNLKTRIKHFFGNK